jgi:60 kDa SS-A/Ro ribonucleoprotein
MSRATKTFTKPKKISVLAPSVNREGYPAWDRPLEEQYLQTILTNTMGNTYYVDKDQLIEESHQVHDRMLKMDALFASQALVYGRNLGFMRLQPIFGLAKLFLAGQNQIAEYVFDKVILTPKDLMDFSTIYFELKGNKSGSAVKRVIGNWMTKAFGSESKVAEYWAIKYGAMNKNSGEGYSLQDLLRVVHPRGRYNSIFEYLMGRDAWTISGDSHVQLQAFENLKKASTNEEKIELITKGRLPHERQFGSWWK